MVIGKLKKVFDFLRIPCLPDMSYWLCSRIVIHPLWIYWDKKMKVYLHLEYLDNGDNCLVGKDHNRLTPRVK